MDVFFTVLWWVIVYLACETESKTLENVDHEDIGSVDNTNGSALTTSEMRDEVLAEWKGRTEEIQGYFDQLPSEEFKENSEDLKFKYYYERKGVKDIDTNQVYNITPHQYHIPAGPMYTVEVNDSYVPKYRVTTSEEERLDKYGTFNSESSEISSEEVKRKKKRKKKKESSDESGDEKLKKKNEKETRPSNMDPKEKRRKKRPKTTQEGKKRREVLEKKLNGGNYIKINLRKVQEENIQLQNPNQQNILKKNTLTKIQGGNIDRKYDSTKNVINKRDSQKTKHKQLQSRSNKILTETKVITNGKDRLVDNNEIEKKLYKFQRQRKRSRQSTNQLRPFTFT